MDFVFNLLKCLFVVFVFVCDCFLGGLFFEFDKLLISDVFWWKKNNYNCRGIRLYRVFWVKFLLSLKSGKVMVVLVVSLERKYRKECWFKFFCILGKFFVFGRKLEVLFWLCFLFCGYILLCWCEGWDWKLGRWEFFVWNLVVFFVVCSFGIIYGIVVSWL